MIQRTREEPAPVREEWEAGARATALRLGYGEAAPLSFRRGSFLNFHPSQVPVRLDASWSDGKGTWTASAARGYPRARAILEARLDEIQGRAGDGSVLRTLARAAAGGFLAWVFAVAALFIFTVPLVRSAREDWSARQKLFEEREDWTRAPSAERVAACPLAPAAFIPAAAFGFLVAIPIALAFLLGELVPFLSRLPALAVAASMFVFPIAFATPGAAGPGLVAGLVAPAAAFLVCAATWAIGRDGAGPSRGPRAAAAIAAVVVLSSIPAALIRQTEFYSSIRDRLLFGTRSGEALATFYYRHHPLAAYAIRPPEVNARTTVLVAGPHPHGFPFSYRRLMAVHARSKEAFLNRARGPGITFILYNDADPWVAEAAAELKATHPARARAFVAVVKGEELRRVFPEAEDAQFVTPELAGTHGPDRVSRVSEAVDLALAKADRRAPLRRVARAATTLSIFVGVPLLLGAVGVWVACAIVALRKRGAKRAAGATAVATFLLAAALVLKIARAEEDVAGKLRAQREAFEAIRLRARTNAGEWKNLAAEADKVMGDLESAASHPDVGVRVLAADALGASGQPRAIALLGEKLVKDPSLLVRYRAADAIGRFNDNRARVRWLSPSLQDEIYVAESALDSILDWKP